MPPGVPFKNMAKFTPAIKNFTRQREEEYYKAVRGDNYLYLEMLA